MILVDPFTLKITRISIIRRTLLHKPVIKQIDLRIARRDSLYNMILHPCFLRFSFLCLGLHCNPTADQHQSGQRCSYPLEMPLSSSFFTHFETSLLFQTIQVYIYLFLCIFTKSSYHKKDILYIITDIKNSRKSDIFSDLREFSSPRLKFCIHITFLTSHFSLSRRILGHFPHSVFLIRPEQKP